MSFCKTALNQARCTWRHNSVLRTIVYHLQSVLTPLNASLCVDIPGYLNSSEISSQQNRACWLIAAKVSQLWNLIVVSNLRLWFPILVIKHGYEVDDQVWPTEFVVER